MARIKTEQSYADLNDYTEIRVACRELGVPFNCERGSCGTCKIIIVKGKEHLAHLTVQERRMHLAENERLACQATIDSGEIEIRF